MNESNTEVLLNKESHQETEAVMEFMGELNQNEKKEFMVFMQGVRFAKDMRSSNQKR